LVLLREYGRRATQGNPGARLRNGGLFRFAAQSKEECHMQLTEKHHKYWRINLRITGILLAIWFVVTFVMGWYARELNEINFIGPLGFYMSAQGSLIIYVAIIWYYAHYMNNLDLEYGVHEGELD